MSYFIIVPVEDAWENYTMLNHSNSNSFDEVRKNSDETKYLFESKTSDPHEVFNGYKWYNDQQIKVELEKVEWQ